MLGDDASVDEGAVATLEILDLEVAVVLDNEAVAAGEGRVADSYLVRAYSANGDFSGGQVDYFVLERASDYTQSWIHDSGESSCLTHARALGTVGLQSA
jgi:hypothetical protein